MLSHRGRVRRANEDACGARPEEGAFVVCDGMGGAAAGEVASHLAVQAFLNELSQSALLSAGPANGKRPNASTHGSTPLSAPDSLPPHPHPGFRTSLDEAVHAANLAVFRHSRKSPSLHGMGTTLVGLCFEPGTRDALWLAHVGDSRCYRLRSGALTLLTSDHTLVEQQVQAGLLNRIQAAISPIRNIITRAVGCQPEVEADIEAHSTQSADLYLLASDGLNRELDDTEIARVLTQALTRTLGPALSDPPSRRSTAAQHTLQAALDNACHTLIEAANQRGGGDNITVLLVYCL
ncbi:MAG: protein phosphatase 2C domain-containing protein [Acidobacteriaceae bacterium]|jgi:protein phosphatase